MYSKSDKIKKSFINVVAMALIVLLGSAFTFLIETNITQLTPSVASSDKWSSYTSKPSGGGLSQDDPLAITNANELAYLIYNLDGKAGRTWYVDLQADIDLSAHMWEPIDNNFNGDYYLDFKGNNHVISNMRINDSSSSVGFMRGFKINVGGLVVNMRDVYFKNADIVSNGDGHYTGVVIGVLFGALNNVNVLSSRIVSNKRIVGGITGCVTENATIENCSSDVDIYCSQYSTGGLVGELRGRLVDSRCVGNVYGTKYVGGIVGSCGYASSEIINCKSYCNVEGDKHVAGLIGTVGKPLKIEKSCFEGTICVNSDTEIFVHPYVAYIEDGSFTITDSYVVADIYLKGTTSLDCVKITANSDTHAKGMSCFSFYRVINSALETKEFRELSIPSTFENWTYSPDINGGIPFPTEWYHVGQFIESDVLAYLQELGFVFA